MRFKDILRDLRKKAGLTQEQLADKAGIPLPSLRGHEQGQRVPGWASVVKLAKALGVTCEVFSDCDEIHDAPDKPPAAPAPPATH
jgi:transcriptional regulator with XRE-family HTH domain